MMKASYREMETGDFYTIEYVWKRKWGGLSKSGHFEMFVLTKPVCSYPGGRAAHLLERDRICVQPGLEPKTIDQAKAISILWMRGYSVYCRTGNFPNRAAKINVA